MLTDLVSLRGMRLWQRRAGSLRTALPAAGQSERVGVQLSVVARAIPSVERSRITDGHASAAVTDRSPIFVTISRTRRPMIVLTSSSRRAGLRAGGSSRRLLPAPCSTIGSKRALYRGLSVVDPELRLGTSRMGGFRTENDGAVLIHYGSKKSDEGGE